MIQVPWVDCQETPDDVFAAFADAGEVLGREAVVAPQNVPSRLVIRVIQEGGQATEKDCKTVIIQLLHPDLKAGRSYAI